MLIDWFTVCAQGVNFLILVWVLKRFLYKPILAAISGREKRVAAEIAEADANRTRTAAERDQLNQRITEFDRGVAARLAAEVQKAGAERGRLLREAGEAAAELRRAEASTLRGETERLAKEVALLAAQEVGKIARRALRDLAGADLERQIVAEFLRRLAGLGPESRNSLSAALQSPKAAALIRSSLDLPPEAKVGIQEGLNRAFSMAVPVRYQTDPEVICGVELEVGGQRLGWSVAEYLIGLESDTGALIATRALGASPGPQLTHS